MVGNGNCKMCISVMNALQSSQESQLKHFSFISMPKNVKKRKLRVVIKK